MRRKKKSPASSPSGSEIRLLVWLAACVSVISFLYYCQRGEILLYGDAVAHINIARRVFDSKTPGLLQLGTVWLPLPHLLMIPFLVSDEMWRRGLGGSIPSLVAYVVGVAGMFRLVRGMLSRDREADAASRIAAGASAIIYAANPNLIYMQTTAMGEPLYLAFFIWTVVYFCEALGGQALGGQAKTLTRCGLCLAAACLTRYDGWFLAVALVVTMTGVAVARRSSSAPWPGRHAFAKLILTAALVPGLWLAYNAIVYGNPLEFENGPYSAKAIERRTQTTGNPAHPGAGNPLVSGLYFLKAGEMNVASNPWLQRAWLLLLFAAPLLVASRLDLFPRLEFTLPLLLLLLPLLFYALSVAYGGVPIFVPPWWPFTHYNVRYGLQLLPAFAVGAGLVVYLAARSRWNIRLRLACVLAVLVVVVASDALIWRSGPICLEEAQVNMGARNQLEAQVAGWLRKLPADCTILMYLGDHVGGLQQAGIPLRHTINEGNHRVWKRPIDPDGLWERALGDPANYSDYVVAFEGDPVWQAAKGRRLRELVEIHVSGQPRAILYRAR